MNRTLATATALALLIAIPSGVGAGTGLDDSTEASVTEGHTTYALVEVDQPTTISLVGDVRCHVEVLRVTVDVPPSVDSAMARCLADAVVYITGADAPDPRASLLQSTGDLLQVEGPDDQTHPVREWTYEGPDGTTHHAWTAPVGPERVDGETGRTYRFVAGLDVAHLPPDVDEVRFRAGDRPAVTGLT